MDDCWIRCSRGGGTRNRWTCLRYFIIEDENGFDILCAWLHNIVTIVLGIMNY